MGLLFLIGGARSGKSRLAVRLASETGAPVAFVATAEPRDAEMADRIARHRAERPEEWQTFEESLRLGETLAGLPAASCAVVDCLSLWVSNLLECEEAADIEHLAHEAARFAAERAQSTIVVSNEVGLGIVPQTPLGRVYRDVLGRVNAIFAEAADEVLFVVAGKVMRLGDV